MTDRQITHAQGCWGWGPTHYECAVRKIKELRADLVESDEISEKLGHLLTRTAAALKGEPPEGTWHSWHDLPEKATQLAEALRKLEERVQRDEALLRQALEALELRCGTNADERKELIPALRERLGEGAEP